MKKWLWIGAGMLATSCLLAGGAIWYIRAHQAESVATTAGKAPVRLSEDPQPNPGVALDDKPAADGNNSGGDSLRVRSSTDDSVQGGVVLGSQQRQTGQTANSGSAGDSNNTNRLPEPNEFGVYEQYNTKQEAMYQEVRVGSGAEAASGKKVAVHYRGWLTNGQVFDESYSNPDKPFVFQLGQGQVIAGWDMGVPGMKVGGKRRLIVPPAVGYGSEARGSIPANSLLVFDVELLAVQ